VISTPVDVLDILCTKGALGGVWDIKVVFLPESR